MANPLEFIISYLSERGLDVSLKNHVGLNFVDSGMIDSFETLSLIVGIEEGFGIKILPHELTQEANKTVDGLARLVEGKRK